MKRVLGSHTISDRSGQTRTMAVLDCGHEVPYGDTKWPEGTAECPVKEHDADGKAMRPEGAPTPTPPEKTGPRLL